MRLWAVLVLSLAWTACGSAGNAPAQYSGTELHGAAPDFALQDQAGRRVALQDFRGKAVVLAFLDPDCTDVCPLTAHHFRQTHEAMGASASGVVFAAVNVNPMKNTVEDMAAATEHWGLAGVADWHFLTGEPAALERVWRSYSVIGGIPKEQAPTQFRHTPGVFLVDGAGNQRWYVSTAYAGAPALKDVLLERVPLLLEPARR